MSLATGGHPVPPVHIQIGDLWLEYSQSFDTEPWIRMRELAKGAADVLAELTTIR